MTSKYILIINEYLQSKYPAKTLLQKDSIEQIILQSIKFKFFTPYLDILFINSYQNLKHLKINYCDLRNLQNFPRFRELQQLDLGYNQIQGTLNNLMPCKKLKFVNLENNIIFQWNKLMPLRKIDKITVCIKNNPFLNKNCTGYQNKLKNNGIKVINEPKDYVSIFSNKKQEQNKVDKKSQKKSQKNKVLNSQNSYSSSIQDLDIGRIIFGTSRAQVNDNNSRRSNQRRHGILGIDSSDMDFVLPIVDGRHSSMNSSIIQDSELQRRSRLRYQLSNRLMRIGSRTQENNIFQRRHNSISSQENRLRRQLQRRQRQLRMLYEQRRERRNQVMNQQRNLRQELRRRISNASSIVATRVQRLNSEQSQNNSQSSYQRILNNNNNIRSNNSNSFNIRQQNIIRSDEVSQQISQNYDRILFQNSQNNRNSRSISSRRNQNLFRFINMQNIQNQQQQDSDSSNQQQIQNENEEQDQDQQQEQLQQQQNEQEQDIDNQLLEDDYDQMILQENNMDINNRNNFQIQDDYGIDSDQSQEQNNRDNVGGSSDDAAQL